MDQPKNDKKDKPLTKAQKITRLCSKNKKFFLDFCREVAFLFCKRLLKMKISSKSATGRPSEFSMQNALHRERGHSSPSPETAEDYIVNSAITRLYFVKFMVSLHNECSEYFYTVFA